jgi:hypothetical protein
VSSESLGALGYSPLAGAQQAETMSLATHHPLTSDLAGDEDLYRPLSSAAVASVVAGVLSLTSFLSYVFWAIPIAGALLGLVALQRIDANPTEVAGRKLALLGILLSALFGGLGAAWQTYAYIVEVPEGYQRISYSELQPAEGRPRDAIPASARLLDGKKVFIKGYMYPGSQSSGIKEFVLVRDRGSCCFGGPTPKLTDMIQVKLKAPLAVNYSTGVRALGGVFRVEPSQASDDLGGVLYHLDADYVK